MSGVLSFLNGRKSHREGPLAERVHEFDRAIELRVEPLRSPGADRLFYSLTNAAEHGLLWLAVGAARAALAPRHRAGYRRLAVAMGVESALTNGVIKTLFRRIRPPEWHSTEPLPYRMRRPITSAFPSGHAASAFTAATLLAEDDRLAPAYYALAALVAGSRVYVRMHYASDVIAGAVWGAAFGRLIRSRFPLQ